MANKIAFNNNFPDISESDKIYNRALKYKNRLPKHWPKGPGNLQRVWPQSILLKVKDHMCGMPMAMNSSI
jgi:glutamate-1-semialdehyde 2,1-aminomutase